MEIDNGPFARELRLPVEVLPAEVTAEQRNGLLLFDQTAIAFRSMSEEPFIVKEGAGTTPLQKEACRH